MISKLFVLFAIFSSVCVSTLRSQSEDEWTPIIFPNLLSPNSDIRVYSILPLNDSLYISGQLDVDVGSNWHGIARLGPDIIWHNLDNGINGWAEVMIERYFTLTIGGHFPTAGPSWGTTVNNLARYVGNEYWTTLGFPGNNPSGERVIKTMVMYDNDLYVGGTFQTPLGYNNFIRHDGTTWGSIGTVDDEVRNLGVHDGDLYMCGLFNNINGSPFKKIAKYDGTNWSDVGGGLSYGECNVLVFNDDDMYIGGSIIMYAGSGDVALYGAGKYSITSSTWTNVGPETDYGDVFSMIYFNDHLYTEFTYFLTSNQILKRDTSGVWSVSATITNGVALCFVANETHLYVSGQFSEINGFEATGIAQLTI